MVGFYCPPIHKTCGNASDDATNTPEHTNDTNTSNSCLIVGRRQVYLTYNSPLLSDASAARAASTSNCYAITKRNAALDNHDFKCPLPTSGLGWRWNSTAPLPPLSLPFASALCAVGRTKTGARLRRTVRMRPCHRLLRAVTMPRTARQG